MNCLGVVFIVEASGGVALGVIGGGIALPFVLDIDALCLHLAVFVLLDGDAAEEVVVVTIGIIRAVVIIKCSAERFKQILPAEHIQGVVSKTNNTMRQANAAQRNPKSSPASGFPRSERKIIASLMAVAVGERREACDVYRTHVRKYFHPRDSASRQSRKPFPPAESAVQLSR